MEAELIAAVGGIATGVNRPPVGVSLDTAIGTQAAHTLHDTLAEIVRAKPLAEVSIVGTALREVDDAAQLTRALVHSSPMLSGVSLGNEMGLVTQGISNLAKGTDELRVATTVVEGWLAVTSRFMRVLPH